MVFLRISLAGQVPQGSAKVPQGSPKVPQGSAKIFSFIIFFSFFPFPFLPLLFVWFVYSFGRFFKVPQGSLRFVKDLLCLERSTRFLKVLNPSCKKLPVGVSLI